MESCISYLKKLSRSKDKLYIFKIAYAFNECKFDYSFFF